jgi:hypothetical protein
MNELTEKILSVATAYLGPAAKIFVKLQVQSHMQNIDINDLKKEHLQELARWLKIASASIIDKGKAEELANKIARL